MAEVYIGTKFETVFESRQPPKDERLAELAGWCRRFAELGVAPGGSGNLSMRSARGFIVTRTGGHLGTMREDEFVEVTQMDIGKKRLTASGAHEPSSESMMHGAIYRARPDVTAVFHGHSDRILAAAERLGWPVTAEERPYGTPELTAEVLKILDAHGFFIMRNHGFVALGRTLHEAGRELERALMRAIAP